MLNQRIVQIATTKSSVVCLCDDGTMWTRPIDMASDSRPTSWNLVPAITEEDEENSAYIRLLRSRIPERSCHL